MRLRRLIAVDHIGLAQRQADFVQPTEQAMFAERVDLEREAILERRGDALRVQIDMDGVDGRNYDDARLTWVALGLSHPRED